VSPSSGNYNSGTTVTLTANPASGYRFDFWGGDISGSSPTITITMNSHKSVVANFSIIRYSLSTSVNPQGGGSVSLSTGIYDAGASVTLTATPASGYQFVSWSGDASGTSPTVTITMNSNKNVIANFSIVATPTTPTDSTVVSEIPGTALSLGASRGSVVDKEAKPRDVYALSLTAGQEVQLKVTIPNGYLTFQLAKPGSQSFQTGNVALAFSQRDYSTWTRNFAPPVTGTYYLAIIADTSAQPYTIEVLLTGR